eukprot:CAMPEP_0175092086 /NCGR_PEP_ID=MMETSP0086_2-20121207/2269_1 /TAXON_ID=136419 /ORGANISM="Unknown Unknown, Strain D1" /LENGTH=52 /DNA_ID=CAMNT_0016364913 /DNA_START=53 /DNA_END=211 /DNA_ORIENTATION=+
MFFIELVHAPGVKEDQRQKDENRALLGEPEPKIGAADRNAGEQGAQDDPEPK